MKKLFLSALLMLCSISAFAQQVQKGHVTAVVQLPSGGTNFSYDFSLLGNADGQPENFFSDSNPSHSGPFSLNYTGLWGCEAGCTYTGNFTKWYRAPTRKDGCVVYAGELTGDFQNGAHYHTDVRGFYSQTFCTQDGASRWGAGDLSMTITQ